jgi:hypothetical protein
MVSQRDFSRLRVSLPFLLSLPHNAMPSLPEIDLGYQPGSYLTPLKRNKIIGISLAGATLKEISSVTRIPL